MYGWATRRLILKAGKSATTHLSIINQHRIIVLVKEKKKSQNKKGQKNRNTNQKKKKIAPKPILTFLFDIVLFFWQRHSFGPRLQCLHHHEPRVRGTSGTPGQFKSMFSTGGNDGAGLCVDWRNHVVCVWFRRQQIVRGQNGRHVYVVQVIHCMHYYHCCCCCCYDYMCYTDTTICCCCYCYYMYHTDTTTCNILILKPLRQ
jgi:hypothetical protein